MVKHLKTEVLKSQNQNGKKQKLINVNGAISKGYEDPINLATSTKKILLGSLSAKVFGRNRSVFLS